MHDSTPKQIEFKQSKNINMLYDDYIGYSLAEIEARPDVVQRIKTTFQTFDCMLHSKVTDHYDYDPLNHLAHQYHVQDPYRETQTRIDRTIKKQLYATGQALVLLFFCCKMI